MFFSFLMLIFECSLTGSCRFHEQFLTRCSHETWRVCHRVGLLFLVVKLPFMHMVVIRTRENLRHTTCWANSLATAPTQAAESKATRHLVPLLSAVFCPASQAFFYKRASFQVPRIHSIIPQQTATRLSLLRAASQTQQQLGNRSIGGRLRGVKT